MGKLFYLAAGGVTGTLVRYYLVGAIYQKLGTNFPYGTLIVNLTGCFLVGLFSVALNEKFFFGTDSKVLLMAGFCGAYTTFSAYMLETSNLIGEGAMLKALLNIVVSTVIGFIALRLGIWVGEMI